VDYSNLFVCAMGLLTVFFGLGTVILLTTVMSYLCNFRQKNDSEISPPPNRNDEVEPSVLAVITAAIEEDLGTRLSNIHLSVTRE